MSLAGYKSAARTWLVNAVNDATKQVIYAAQPGSGSNATSPPQPAEPYVTLRTLSLSEIAMGENEPQADASGQRTVYDRYRAVMTCQFIGTGSEQLAINCKRALNKNEVIDAFSSADVGVVDSGDILFVPEVRDGTWRDRHTMDVVLDVPDSFTEEVGFIEHVEITMTIKRADGTTVVSRDFTVDV